VSDSAIVARTIGVDFIYLDLLFLIIWIGLLVKKRYWIPIKWGFIGFFAYLLTDYIIWYLVMKSRHYTGPINPMIFFLWFTFSPGFVQFSYVFVMFEKRNFRELGFWTILFYIGWTFVALGSQLMPLDDRLILIWRDMNADNQRLTFLLMTIGNVILGFILVALKKIRWEDFGYIFLVGTLVEFALEFSLAVSGIREQQGTWSWELMVINLFIEFNMGIILMYEIYIGFLRKRNRIVLLPLLWRDRQIHTDFNAISLLCQKGSLPDGYFNDIRKLYSKSALLQDIEFYFDKYHPEQDRTKLIEKFTT
jgi:hypothetical protein